MWRLVRRTPPIGDEPRQRIAIRLVAGVHPRHREPDECHSVRRRLLLDPGHGEGGRSDDAGRGRLCSGVNPAGESGRRAVRHPDRRMGNRCTRSTSRRCCCSRMVHHLVLSSDKARSHGCTLSDTRAGLGASRARFRIVSRRVRSSERVARGRRLSTIVWCSPRRVTRRLGT